MRTARVATARAERVRCGARWRCAATGLVLVALATACVTPAEFRKLERRVIDMERQSGGGDESGRLAELGAQVDALQLSVDEMQGRLEVTEHRVQEALEEARSARSEANRAAAPPKAGGEAAQGGEEVVESAEVLAYRAAYGEWRAGDSEACIDRFTEFLQTYPSSEYADDATYWLADCYF